ncbi:MAG TPA: NUDIX domain-containing protein [Candidatus Paceibacterota bacterium]
MAHIHEKIDFTASVYIVHDNAVFLHLHTKTGKWLPVGGHIELDEDPNEAVVREAKEESGLDVELIGPHSESAENDDERDLIPPRFMNRHHFRVGEPHEHVDLVYFGRAQGRDVRMEEETDYKWFSRDDLERADLLPKVRYYALAALAELGS